MAASHPVERAGIEPHQRDEDEAEPREDKVVHGDLLWKISY